MLARDLASPLARPLARGLETAPRGEDAEVFTALQMDIVTKEMRGVLKGVGDLTEARSSTIYQRDWDDIWRAYESTQQAWFKGRRVKNLILESEDFSTIWETVEATITINQTTDPFDGSAADKLLETTADNVHRVHQTIPFAVTIGRQYTSSVYVKGGLGRDWVDLQADWGGINNQIWFDITNGVIGVIGALSDAEGIIDDGDGWFRVWQTITAISTGTGQLRVLSTNANNVSAFIGDATKGLFVYGAMIEDVSGQTDPAPSDYIATTTVAVAKTYGTKRRTNVLHDTDDLAAGDWAGTRGTYNNTTQKFTEDSTLADTHVLQANQGELTLVDTRTYSLSIEAKVGGRNRFHLRLGSSNQAGALFDVAGVSVIVAGTEVISSSITLVDNGFFRCDIVLLAQTLDFVYIGLAEDSHTSIVPDTYDGDGVSGMLFRKPQIEPPSFTSYIENTSFDQVASSAFDRVLDLPWLHRGPAGTNEIPFSRDLADAAWSESGTSVAALDAVGLEGTENTASTLTDDNVAALESVADDITIPDDSNTDVARFFIFKDTDETRFPEFQLRLIDGTTREIALQVNTKTGASTARVSTGTTDSEVNDVGLWWEVLLEVVNNTSGNLTAQVGLLPAISTTFGTLEVAATGSIIVGNVELHLNKTIVQVRGTTPIFTSGSTVSVDASDPSFDAANHDNAQGAYFCEFMPRYSSTESPAVNLGIVENVSPIYMRGNAFRSNDGIVTIVKTTVWADGDEIKLGCAYGDSLFSLNVNGSFSVDSAYDGAFGAPGAVFDILNAQQSAVFMRNLRRYDLDYVAAQAKIDELMAA